MRNLYKLCALVMCAAMITPAGAVYAESGLNESFEAAQVGSAPNNWTFSGAKSGDVSVAEENGNRSLMIKTSGSSYITASRSFGTVAGSIVAEAKVMIKQGGGETALRITDNNGNVTEPIVFSGTSMLSAYDGSTAKDISSYSLNNWYRVALAIDTQSGMYDVYLNGEKAIGDCRLPLKGTGGAKMDYSGGIAAIGANVYQGSDYGYTTILWDDFRVYNAAAPKRDEQFETLEYSDENNTKTSVGAGKYGFTNGQPILMLPDTSAIALDERILAYDHFVDDFTGRLPRWGWNNYTKGNLVTIEELPNAKNPDNKACRIEVINSSSCDEQRLFVENPIAEDFTVEVSWYADELIGMRYICLMNSPHSCMLVTHNADGSIRDTGGNVIGSCRGGEWVDVRVAVHWKERYADYWVNGESVAVQVPFQFNGTDINSIRFGASGGGVSWFDNVCVYRGTEEIDTRSMPEGTFALYENLLADDSGVLERLGKGTIAMKIDSNIAYVDGVRTNVDREVITAVPKLSNSKTVVPVRFILENLGFHVDWDGENSLITAYDGSRTIKILTADGIMYSDNDDGKREYDCLVEDGRCLVPIRVLANWVGKRIYWNDDGVCILCDNAKLFDEEKDAELISRLYRMMTFTRPTGEQILSDIKKKFPGYAHNRLYLTDERLEVIRGRCNSGDEETIKWVENYIASARRNIGIKPLDYSIPDGKRLLDTSRTMEARFMMYAVAYRLSGDTEIAEQCWKEMKHISEYPNWNETHFLDTAEMCRGFAIAYDALYDWMDEQQRALCVETIKEKALYPSLYEYRYGNGATHSKWAGGEGNWNPVCNACMMIGAVAIAESDEELAAEILESALQGMEGNLVFFAPDGAWSEGPGYWHYTIEFLSYGLDALYTSTGTIYNYLDVAGVGATANYYIAMTGPGGTFNYGDMTPQYIKSPELYWYAEVMNKPELAAIYRDMEQEYAFGTGSLTRQLHYNKEFADSADLSEMPLDMYFRKWWVGSLRSSWRSSDATYIAFQGGRPNAGHSQMSMGNFVYDAMGERWAIDLGYDDYNIGYLGLEEGSTSWWIYRKSTEGHNCFLVNPDDKLPQIYNSDSPIVDFRTGGMGGYSVIDLTPAYARNVKSAYRGFKLDRAADVVTVQDEIDMKYANSECYWFMHTKADIEIAPDGQSAILSQGGKRLWVGINTPQEAKFSIMDTKVLPTSGDSKVRDLEAENEGVKKLTIHLTGLSGKNTISVSMVGLKDLSLTKPAVTIDEVTPIADWTIPEGELIRPALTQMYVDGEILDGFDGEEKHNYTVRLPFGAEEVPEVSAEGDAEISVTQANELPGAATVKVSKDGMTDAYYIVTFRVQPLLNSEPEGLKRLPVKRITASAEPQEQNPAVHAMDGDYETRWAANGENWITFELDSVQTVSAFMTAWISGAERLEYFDMQTSLNGKDWVTHFAGESSGETDKQECYMIGDTKAKYVRIKVHGNSTSSWNSLAEFAVYGK